MRLRRAAVAASAAALTLLAAGCGTVPSSSAATVGDVDIAMDDLDGLLGHSSLAYRLPADELALAGRAEQAGVLDRAALDQGLTDLVSGPVDPAAGEAPPGDLSQTTIPRICPAQEGDEASADADCPPTLVDWLFERQREVAGDAWSTGLEELGLTEDRWRELFGDVAVAELAGLYQSGGQPFDLAMTDVGQRLQTNLLSQLINAEIARQAYDEMGLQLDDEAVEAQANEILSTQFDSDAAAEAILQLSGYTLETFREVFVATNLRQVELDQVQNGQDAGQAQALTDFYEDLDVSVAARFGDWDAQGRAVVAPERLDDAPSAPDTAP